MSSLVTAIFSSVPGFIVGVMASMMYSEFSRSRSAQDIINTKRAEFLEHLFLTRDSLLKTKELRQSVQIWYDTCDQKWMNSQARADTEQWLNARVEADKFVSFLDHRIVEMEAVGKS